ncbi:MAG: glycosyltransferase family 2 protein [Candidatus Nanohaloarchaea archaeon]
MHLGMSSNPSVSIILLNWNSAEHTIECIESLLQIIYDNFDIIVIDNNSGAQDIELIKEYAEGNVIVDPLFGEYSTDNKPLSLDISDIEELSFDDIEEKENYDQSITLIKNNSNDGFPGGCNIGINYALQNESDYILLLNNDVVVDKSFLNRLVDALETNPSAGIAGSKIYYYDDPKRIQSIGGDMIWWMFWPLDYGMGEIDSGKHSNIEERDFVWATSQLIDTSVFNEVGLLDEEFFFGIEEYDLCDRAKRAGYSILFIPNSKIWHKGSASAKKLDKYPDTRSMIQSETGFLDYKLVRHAVRKHYGGYKWIVPFILRYFALLLNIIRHKSPFGKNRDGKNNI